MEFIGHRQFRNLVPNSSSGEQDVTEWIFIVYEAHAIVAFFIHAGQ